MELCGSLFRVRELPCCDGYGVGLFWRFGIFLAFTLGLGRGLSWVLGEDADVLIGAQTNRPSTLVVLLMSFAVYAMYDWLREDDRQ